MWVARAHDTRAVIVYAIGRNCVIAPWVTIGTNGSVAGPHIGDDVFIGTGAKVLGAIHVGDRVRIGANAVVIEDVPPDTTVVGIPARPVRQSAIGSRQP